MASISELLIARGQQEAESRRARAATWVPLIQHLSNLPGQIMADRQAERAAGEAAFDRQQQRDVRALQIAKGEQELDTAEASAEQKRQMNDVLSSGVIGEDGRFDIAAAQRIASEKGYRDIQDDVLTFGREWNEGVEKGLLTKEQIEAAKRSNQPQGYTLNPGDKRYGPDNQLVAEVPAAERPLTFGALQKQMVGGRPTLVRQRSDGAIVDLKGNVLEDVQPMPESAGRQSLTPNMEANVIRQLATQWTTASKPARDLDRQVSIMDAGIKAAERGDLAQGSQAVLVTFQKLLDPTSVVRESEYARSAAGLALTSRARGAYERLAQGGAGVPLPELKKFAALAREMAEAQRSSYLENTKERLGKTADRYSIPRELVFEAPGVEATDQPAPGRGVTITAIEEIP